MPYSNQDPLPACIGTWARGAPNKATDKDGEIWQPDFSDPLYLKYWGELVAEAGKRYDGNPYLDSVDISSVAIGERAGARTCRHFPIKGAYRYLAECFSVRRC